MFYFVLELRCILNLNGIEKKIDANLTSNMPVFANSTFSCLVFMKSLHLLLQRDSNAHLI